MESFYCNLFISFEFICYKCNFYSSNLLNCGLLHNYYTIFLIYQNMYILLHFLFAIVQRICLLHLRWHKKMEERSKNKLESKKTDPQKKFVDGINLFLDLTFF